VSGTPYPQAGDHAPPPTQAALGYRSVQGVRVPTFLYGTAWKESDTARLTQLALARGFRGIDTANQRKHYHEAGVGEGLKRAMGSVPLARDEVFLQTKFTFRDAQDHRLPYDPRAPVGRQVVQSFESSLEHLGVHHLDAYLLHGPSRRGGLAGADWEAWRAMEELQRAGRTKLIGVSNVMASQLGELRARARVPPALVQNRCFARPESDRAVRALCEANGILYEGFSLLTAIPEVLRHPVFVEIATKSGMTSEQALFRFVLERGVVALTGTLSERHMSQDLTVYGLPLHPADGAVMAGLLGW